MSYKGIISESGGGKDLPTVAYVQPFMTSFVTALNCSVTDVSGRPSIILEVKTIP
jgi:hypothetical protein